MKYVLIIGAKNELGLELASLYARNNYNIYLAGRAIIDLEEESSNLEKKHKVKVVLCELDVTDYESHYEFYESLEIKPTGVIYLAGYYPNTALSVSKWSETFKTVEVNYLGCMSIFNIIANQFIKDRKGFMISISSVSGVRGRAKNYIYGSSKAALTTYMSGLRNRLDEYNVNVLTVISGYLSTINSSKLDRPNFLTSSPKKLASDIFSAQQQNKSIIYSNSLWRIIMFIIKIIPEYIFKKLKI